MTQAQADRMRTSLEAAKARRGEVPKRWTNLPTNTFTQDYIDEHEESYGTLNVPIVGCQYYKGVIHKGEMAILIREPTNQYDPNAIRVDNLAGAQVGHVKRTYATVLAPLMDDPSLAAPRAEVTIPREASSMYEVAAELTLLGLPQHAEAALAALRVGGFSLVGGHAEKLVAARAAAAQAAAQAARDAARAEVDDHHFALLAGAYSLAQQPAVQPASLVVKMDTASCERELDALFEKELALQGAISTDAAAAALASSVVRSALLPHQLQALAWMMVQEDEASPPPASVYERRVEGGREVWFCTVTNSSMPTKPQVARGGLLCDDMGLGKTLTTLALVAVNQPAGIVLGPAPTEAAAAAAVAGDEADADAGEAGEAGEADGADEEEFDEEEETRQAKRLRVAALREELAAHGQEEGGTKPTLVERLVNAKRAAAAAARAVRQLAANQAAAQATKQTAAAARPAKAEAPDGAGAGVAAAHAAGCGGTLVICPTSVLSNWATQVSEHLPGGALHVVTHHGAGKESSAEGLAAAHVVLTTFGTLAADWAATEGAKEGGKGGKAGGGKKRKAAEHASLFALEWHRIILDEAHTIRNRNTQACKAVLALRGARRWCLSGTPMVNRAEDLQPLFAFIRAPPASDAAIFKRAVSQPLRAGDVAALARLRVLLKAVSMRRTKALLAATLPSREVELHYVELGAEGHGGRADYDAVHAAAAAAVRAIAAADDFSQNLTILESLLRLRQLCAAPALVSRARVARAHAQLEQLASAPAASAGAQQQLTVEAARRVLGALSDTRDASSGSGGAGANPDADADADADAPQSGEAEADGDEAEALLEYGGLPPSLKGQPPPPKVELLCSLIAQTADDERCVVFSQFIGVLDICADVLEARGLSTCRIDGSHSAAARAATIAAFGQAAGGPKVILCSLRAAGVGLNLARANRAFMMDLWWNPSVEDQAMDRIHRIGQTRPVKVVRFVTRHTVEQRILELQVRSNTPHTLAVSTRPRQPRAAAHSAAATCVPGPHCPDALPPLAAGAQACALARRPRTPLSGGDPADAAAGPVPPLRGLRRRARKGARAAGDQLRGEAHTRAAQHGCHATPPQRRRARRGAP